MSVRLYRSDELPPEVPGALFSDGETTVVLVNPTHLRNGESSAWFREVINSLLAEGHTDAPQRLARTG